MSTDAGCRWSAPADKRRVGKRDRAAMGEERRGLASSSPGVNAGPCSATSTLCKRGAALPAHRFGRDLLVDTRAVRAWSQTLASSPSAWGVSRINNRAGGREFVIRLDIRVCLELRDRAQPRETGRLRTAARRARAPPLARGSSGTSARPPRRGPHPTTDAGAPASGGSARAARRSGQRSCIAGTL